MVQRSRRARTRTQPKKVKRGCEPASSAPRCLTPHDLAALRPAYEECASLSAPAAVLAVLADRIGEKKKIIVRPGDLSHDLRRYLHWRDIPAPRMPKLIGTSLRRLGFPRAKRNRQGVRFEIPYKVLWSLDPREVSAWWDDLDVRTLGGAKLLRLLAREQSLFFAPKLLCPSCKRLAWTVWGQVETKSWP